MLTDYSMEFDEFAATLSAARSQDPDATEQLFKHCYPRVEEMVHRSLQQDIRMHRAWIQSRFSTGDVVQEVFRGLLKDLSTFDGDTEGALLGYLSMVVRNRIVDALRFHQAAQRDGRQTSSETSVLGRALDRDGPGTVAGKKEELEIFHELLGRLPEKERLLLRARLEEDMTFQDLADRLGYSSKYAARRAFYAAQAQLAIGLGMNESEQAEPQANRKEGLS